MFPSHPPIPPLPNRTTEDGILDGTLVRARAATNANDIRQPINYHHPRSNTAPSIFHPDVAGPSRPRLPQKPAEYPKTVPMRPSPLPPSLIPGALNSVMQSNSYKPHEGALFFQMRAPMSSPLPMREPSGEFLFDPMNLTPPALPPKPNQQPRPPDFNVPAQNSPAPELPPKPSMLSGSNPGLVRPMQTAQSNSPQTMKHSNSIPSCNETDDLARALTLSLEDQGNSQEAGDWEDKILAQVINESMRTMQLEQSRFSATTSASTSGAANVQAVEPIEFTIHPEQASGNLESRSCSCSPTPEESSAIQPSRSETDESMLKDHDSILLEEEDRRRKQLEMDEQFARILAEEEERSILNAADSVTSCPSPSRESISQPDLTQQLKPATVDSEGPGSANAPLPTLPVYDDVVRDRPFTIPSDPPQPPLSIPYSSVSLASAVSSSPGLPRPLPSVTSSPSSRPPANTMSIQRTKLLGNIGRSISAQAEFTPTSEDVFASTDPIAVPAYADVIQQRSILADSHPIASIPVQRSQSANAVPIQTPKLSLGTLTRTLATGGKVVADTASIQETAESSTSVMIGSSNNPGTLASNASDDDESQELTVPSVPMPIVEDDLLMGVSFGFSPPSITPTLALMQGPIPNVITLPYGKCPPLHIQASSWKQLLKLLTRLSDSRIEPTVQALAGTKSELKLRTVIQFIKAHHSSNEWRTILYLTIDVPVPPQTPNAFKYVNGDVNTLPWSYSMSPLPTLLRDGDSMLSRYYTVPSTTLTPYPTLPITLPNFAMYLQAVLDDSRRAMNDSSSGLRKLAKIADSIYPAVNASDGLNESAGSDRLKVGNFFRRALGRGDRNSRRGGNADTYEFITPFRVDEYQ